MTGLKKPVNIFRLGDTGEPAGVFNRRLCLAVLSFGLLGAARGIDEGLISGAINTATFRRAIEFSSHSLHEQANIKANISSMVMLGSVGGALIASVLCDRIGRIPSTRVLCILWAAGIAIFMAGGAQGNLGVVYAGRFIAGLGVGQTPVVGPVYLAEISPPSIRGICTCIFTGAVYLGIVLAYFANYGCHEHVSNASRSQWLIPTSLHIILAGLILLTTLVNPESPRFLVRRGRTEQAAAVLSRLRGQPPDSAYVQAELDAIQGGLDRELEAGRAAGALGELLLNRNNLYRLYLSTAVQLLSQWSGAGSITVYAVDFFRLLGVRGASEGLLVTAIFGVVKFASAMVCALFLVDFLGRKRSLLTGISLQAVSMVYVAGYLTSRPHLAFSGDSAHGNASPDDHTTTAATTAAIVMMYLSGAGWALGWNSMQYLLTAELYPLRVRALATSWAMALHFANQYGSSRAVPNMLLARGDGGITPQGTFWCFAAVTLLGGGWVWFFVPETGGRSLESMDRLFELPWYRIGRCGQGEDVEETEKRGGGKVMDNAAMV